MKLFFYNEKSFDLCDLYFTEYDLATEYHLRSYFPPDAKIVVIRVFGSIFGGFLCVFVCVVYVFGVEEGGGWIVMMVVVVVMVFAGKKIGRT